VQNFKQAKAFAQRTGASVPDWLAHRFEGLDNDVATRKLIAAAVAAEQVLDLADRGVTDFHFYTMNRADLVYAICHLLGLRPGPSVIPGRAPLAREPGIQTEVPRLHLDSGSGASRRPGMTAEMVDAL